MRDLEKLSIISSTMVADQLELGGSVSYLAEADADGEIVQWWMRCTTAEGERLRVISTSRDVRDRTFKTLTALYSWHQRAFDGAKNQTLCLPTAPEQWSPEHRFE